MPKLLSVLSVVGTAAMLWVGGHILLVGAYELGWHTPYDFVHDVEHALPHDGAVGGIITWVANTLCSAVLGLAVGTVIALVVARLPFGKAAPATG
jgi:predicted DNA repair protein MutK